MLEVAAEPILRARQVLRRELAGLEKLVRNLAVEDPVSRLLMTMPGVGPVVALTFVSAIDDPGRFRRSKDVGPWVGLTPGRNQSGERDIAGVIAGTRFPMMHVVSLVCRIVSLRSSTQVRSALVNRFGPGMTLEADAPTTDRRENPATDTSGSIPPRTGRRSSGATPNRSRYGLRKTVNHAEGHSTHGRCRGS